MINNKVDKFNIMSPVGDMQVTWNWILGELHKPNSNYKIVGQTVFINNSWSISLTEFHQLQSEIRNNKINQIIVD